MPQVKVYNDNKYDFTDTFKGQKITVPAGGFIEMDWEEATEFKSAFYPMKVSNSVHDPRNFKMIRVEAPKPHELDVQNKVFVNHFTGEEFADKEGLMASLSKHEANLHEDARKELAKQRTSKVVI